MNINDKFKDKSAEELKKISLGKNKKGVATADALEAQLYIYSRQDSHISNRNYRNHKKYTTETNY